MFSSGLLMLFCGLAAAQYRPQLDGRIVGGADADIVNYPHQLSLRSWGSHICGASIISEDWVLTAAHCVKGSFALTISFRAGSSLVDNGGSIYHAKKIHVHPKYQPKTSDYDYALIKVKQPFPIGTPGVNAVVIANAEPAAGTVTTVTGWGALSSGGGAPTQLQEVDVTVIDRATCNGNYGSNSITDRMICAADPGKDSCQGDSGGPLINKSTKELVGVVSWGYGCADPNYPGVYANPVVADVRDWIASISNV